MANQGRYVVRAITIALIAGIFCLFLTVRSWGEDLATPQAFSMGNSHYVEDELLVQHKAGVPDREAEQILSEQGAFIVDELPQIRVKRIKVPAHALEKVKAALAHNPRINFVENNYFMDPSLVPNDTGYLSQWHLPKISAAQGWDLSIGSAGVPIAIVDTGADRVHPDLASKLLPGYNFYANNTDTQDYYGHGTKVAGSAAAISNNSVGVAGVAWLNPIMPIVISSPTGSATSYALAQGIAYAVDHSVRVINISWGTTSASSTLQSAVNYAWNNGAIVVAAACNYANSTPCYPAACTNAVAVSATTSSDAIASFSNYGNWIAVSAPGASIYTTASGGGYASVSGTSFSSPITAGLAALILSVNPSLTNADVVNIIKQNADDLGTAGFDPYYGNGRINVHESLVAALYTAPQPDTAAPTAVIVTPEQGATVSGNTTVNVSAADNEFVSEVSLYVDGSLFATDTTGPYSFSWDTTKYPNGIHDLVAYAYDAADNIGQSSHVSVSVSNAIVPPSTPDTTPPVVSFGLPSSTTIVKKVTITASATDNVGVTKIELYIDGVLKSSVSGSTSLTYNWNTVRVSRGAHTVIAKAYDAAKNVGTATKTLYK